MKKIFQDIPRGIRYLFASFVILFFFVMLFRLAFYLFFMESAVKDQDMLRQAWLTGIASDVRLCMLTLLPAFAFIIFCDDQIFRKKGLRTTLLIYFIIIHSFFLSVYLLDLNSYVYFGNRLDTTFFHYFGWNRFWNTFPVMKEGLLTLVLLYILYRLSYAAYERFEKQEYRFPKMKKRIFWYCLTGLLMAVGIYGNFGAVSLQKNNFIYSDDAGIEALSLNPVLHFITDF